MINILRVMRYELMRGIRRKSYLFTTFGLPVLAIVVSMFLQNILGGTNGEDPLEPETLMDQLNFNVETTSGFVDYSGLFTGVQLPEHLILYDDQTLAEQALEAEEVTGVYVLPVDYAETGEVLLLVNSLQVSLTSAQPVTQIIFNDLRQTVEASTLVRLRFPAVFNDVSLNVATTAESEVARNEQTDFWLVYVFALLFLFTVFSTSGYLMQSVIEEKESRLVEILISAIRPLHLLTGKVLANGVLGLLQISAWIAVGVLVIARQDFAVEIVNFVLATVNTSAWVYLAMAIYFVLGYLMFAAVFGGIGAVSNSLREGPQLSLVIVLPALAPFFFLDTFINNPNDPVAVFLSIFPLTSPLAMPMRLLLADINLIEVMISVVLLVGLVGGMFWVAGRLFRVQTLLAGNAPQFWQIPGLIFKRN